VKKNMGVVDRTFRTIAAIIIAILYLSNQLSGTLGDILGVVAILFLVTSAIGFCPLYVPLKISTQKKQKTPAAG
jgi:hypothetical protein